MVIKTMHHIFVFRQVVNHNVLPFREAWHKLGKMSKEEAMKKYVEVVCRVDPGWETTPLDPADQQVANCRNNSRKY